MRDKHYNILQCDLAQGGYDALFKHYYKDGTTSSKYDRTKILHREDGPAIEYPSGYKEWRIDNKLHRIDGPAVEYSNGLELHWYIDDQYYSEGDFYRAIREVKQLPLALKLIDPREWVRKL